MKVKVSVILCLIIVMLTGSIYAISISIGGYDGCSYSYTINEQGEVYVSGENQFGQLGVGHTNDILTPVKVNTLNGVKVIGLESWNGCNIYYITEQGEVYVSGLNDYGQLGVGHTNNVLTPVKVNLNEKK